MRARGRCAPYLGLAATIAVLAGCGGSTTESSQPAPGGSTTTAPGGSTTTAPGASTTTAPAAVDRVVMGDYYFRPGTITVTVGERVSFVNEGKIQHTVADTSASGEIRSRLIKPRPLDPGQSQEVVFHTPGTVTYLCTFHPTLMSGRIIVTR